MIDVDAVRAKADLVEVVRRYVDLKKSGSEWQGLCPFHDERSPSFTVNEAKGFVHCFGCGAHHDVIGFVMRKTGASFVDACKALGGAEVEDVRAARRETRAQVRRAPPGGVWIPVKPPAGAPELLAGVECTIFNPKRADARSRGFWRLVPQRADAYHAADGSLLGYVLRTEIDGKKLTPQVTWCIGPDGSQRWCVRPFGAPRPLQGLDALAAKPNAPVLVVEGEKCRAAGAGALPPYAVIAWPGGGKGISYVDWSPLQDRDVVLWPDADAPGRNTMLGWTHHDGTFNDGIAQLAHRAGCRSIRFVDTGGQPKGWDIADALDEGWTPRQLAMWAALRVKDVVVESRAA